LDSGNSREARKSNKGLWDPVEPIIEYINVNSRNC